MIYTLIHWTTFDNDVPDRQTINSDSIENAVRVASEYMQNPFTIACSCNGSASLCVGSVPVADFYNFKFHDYTANAYRLGIVGNIKRYVENT